MPSWNWGESQSESGVVHQSTANTDHNDAATLKQGYDYAYFSEITPDPVACWPLHEDSGTTANDVAGTNDGTINGATVGQTGLLGTTAYSFDGNDDFIDSNYVPNGTTPWSLSMWVNFDSFTSPSHIFGGYDGSNQLRVAVENDSTIDFYTFDGSVSGLNNATISTISAGNWYHFAFVHTGSDMIVYINGAQEAITTNSTWTPQTNTAGIGVGQRSGGNNNYTSGDIADVRVYHDALTASEVQTLYDVVATQGTWTGSPKPL